MIRKYSVVVIGLGIVGSASLWRISCSKTNVLGVDSGAIVNLVGSSHGGSRIFRRAYWEGTSYLPLLSLSNDLWIELDKSCSKRLMFNTGGLFLGPIDSGVVPKSTVTARHGGVKYEHLSVAEIANSFPAFRVLEGMEALYEEGAYTIAADDSKQHMIDLAVRNGAEIRFETSVTAIERSEHGLTIRMGTQDEIHAERIILATGASLGATLISDLSGLLKPKSVPVYWFKPKAGREWVFNNNFPAFLYQLPDGRLLYGTPEINQTEPGIKIGFHNYQQAKLDLTTHLHPVDQYYIAEITACVRRLFADLHPDPYASKKCIYTMSPDESFILGESEDLPGVFYCSACSGHGFKFATGLGEILSRSALEGKISRDVSIFNKQRFGDSS